MVTVFVLDVMQSSCVIFLFYFLKQLDTPHIFSKWMCTYFKNKISPIALLIRCYNHMKESHPVRPEKIDKLLPICRPKPVRDDT